MIAVEDQDQAMDEQQRPDLESLRIPGEQRQGGGGGRGLLLAGLLVLIVAVVVVTLIAARGSTVEVAVAVAQPVAESGSVAVLNASGYVTPRRRATVAAKITGRVVEVLVDEGMRVEEGQVLARLDDSDARARHRATVAEREVARATLADLEVNLANAERTLRRTRELHRDDIASEKMLDDAETQVDSLQAQLELARQRLSAAAAQVAVIEQDLDNYTIRAPFAGIAVSKDAQPGEMVSPVSAGGGYTRTGISTIVDMESLEIEVDVNESYIARVTPGQPVEAVLDAYPEWRIPARVRTVIPTADRQKATVKVRITFDRLDPRILPDMGVKVAFLEAAEGEQSGPTPRATIPSAAVRTIGGRSMVFVLDGDVVRRRAVSLGRESGGEVAILAGVAAGEQVVVNGPDQLEDGQRARIGDHD